MNFECCTYLRKMVKFSSCLYCSMNFKTIMIVIYQSVSFIFYISKMCPAIFSVDFQGQGQRSKVTAIKYIGHMTIAKFMADLPCESAANWKISKVNTF